MVAGAGWRALVCCSWRRCLRRGAVWRMGGLFAVGLSLGLICSATFHAISPIYTRDTAATLNLAARSSGWALC